MAGRSKPVELPTRGFEKQGDATAFFKAMLNRYRPGELLFAPTEPPHASRDSGKGSGQTLYPVPAP